MEVLRSNDDATCAVADRNDIQQQQQQQQHHHPSIVHVTLNHHSLPLEVVGNNNNNNLSESEELEEERRRREVLARRPSYRKILNEITGEDDLKTTTSQLNAGSLDCNDTGSELSDTGSENVNLQEPMPSIIQMVTADTSGLQTITMSNSSSPTPHNNVVQTVQYAQGAEGQRYFIPVSVTGSCGETYQITTTNNLHHHHHHHTTMTNNATSSSSPNIIPEENSRKRELRLLKNREAARECRRKKKEYVKCLENRVAVLENQNKALIEELKNLKELYCSKEEQGGEEVVG